MNILLTGGSGYIGSHSIIEIDKTGHSMVVVDNFVNSQSEALKRVAKIIGKEVPFIGADCRDREAMERVFNDNKIDAVINFAGLKAVGESVAKPLEYYENNMNGVFVLVDVMRKHGCKNIIFSSSTTVYGNPAKAKAELGWEAQFGIEEMCRISRKIIRMDTKESKLSQSLIL